MNVHVLPAGPIETNAYLLTQPATGEAILIDAPGEVWPDVKYILEKEKCTLKGLWLTHGHWDHTQGAAEVVRHTGAEVVGHRADRQFFEEPQVMAAFSGMELELPPVAVTRWVAQGDVLAALGTSAEVRHVPGHCPGNILFYFATEAAAYVGDALFKASIGRTDFPGCSFHELEKSIRTQIYTLPDATTVYPGHGPETTVGVEKRTNPYVRSA